MIFQPTAEQLAIKQTAADYAQKFLAPGLRERDFNDEFSRELWEEMVKLDLTKICWPQEYGGLGLDALTYIMAVEEISKVDDGMGVALSVHCSLCTWPIYEYGTQAQKDRYLADLVTGKKMGAFGLTEPNAGTDAASQESTAVKQGDKYILNGKKIFITNAKEAETYVVFAMTDKAKGLKGISAFIVERGMPGFKFGKKEDKMGIRTSLQHELYFENVAVPVENLLGKEGEGFKIAMTTLDGGRIGIAAQALGIAQAALQHSIKYAKERVQFGKSIATQQINAFKLADMATQIEAARFLVYNAAATKDAHRPFSKEAAMAKLFASDTAMAVTTEAVQIHGGNGFCKDYPVERLMRNAKITQIYEGTNEVQKIVISSALLR